MKEKTERIVIAGFGGQGVLLCGKILAQVGMEEGKKVTWLPSYGPEMRGGTANCHVVISSREIGSPLVHRPDVLIAMNRPSLEKFENSVKKGGVIYYDSSLIDVEPKRKDTINIPVPATRLADSLGSTKSANMVMIGAYVGHRRFLKIKNVIENLDRVISAKHKDLIEINVKAIKEGEKYVKEGGRK